MNLAANREFFKAALASLTGKDLSSTAKLVALCEAFGIDSNADLESLVEARPSTLREAKRALKIQRQKSSAAGNPAPEIQQNAGNPSQTLEIQRQKSSVPSRAHATKELPSEVVILNNNTPLPPNPSLEALRAFEAYNAVALRCGLPQAAKLTPARERSIKARLKTYGIEGWNQALANLEKSAFCRGQTATNFRADLDFVCQAKSFDRLHDGGYGNGAHAPKPIASVVDKAPRMTREQYEQYAEMGLV